MTENDITAAINGAKTLAELEQVRLDLLGRKGALTEQLRRIGELAPDKRAAAGAEANRLRITAEEAISKRQSVLELESTKEELATRVDLTAPGMPLHTGHRHPVSVMLEDLIQVFWQMGYKVADGPEVETEWHNFEALNIPATHPARDMQDTFYLEGGNLPRTHTSGVQVRYMIEHKDDLPIRIVSPGKVYRNEDEDARHSWSFYQLEGLVVDEGISIADLKGTLQAMMRGVLGPDTEVRLRPNYFPYTEPSVEMDATCVICHGTGVAGESTCRLCGGTGWLELGGAGMVHPQVLRNVGIDPTRFSGFAFGFGPERIAAVKYNVGDVREFWRPDFNFLDQF